MRKLKSNSGKKGILGSISAAVKSCFGIGEDKTVPIPSHNNYGNKHAQEPQRSLMLKENGSAAATAVVGSMGTSMLRQQSKPFDSIEDVSRETPSPVPTETPDELLHRAAAEPPALLGDESALVTAAAAAAAAAATPLKPTIRLEEPRRPSSELDKLSSIVGLVTILIT